MGNLWSRQNTLFQISRRTSTSTERLNEARDATADLFSLLLRVSNNRNDLYEEEDNAVAVNNEMEHEDGKSIS